MKRFSIFSIMLIFMLALSFGFVSCDLEGLLDRLLELEDQDDYYSSSGPQNANVVGTWRGNDYDGEPLTLTLRSNLTFTLVYEWGWGETEHGNYSVSGNSITMRDSYGYAVYGTVSGNTIRFNFEGRTVTFTRG